MAEQPNVRSQTTRRRTMASKAGPACGALRIRFAQEHQPLCRQAEDPNRLRCLGLAQRRKPRRRIESGVRM